MLVVFHRCIAILHFQKPFTSHSLLLLLYLRRLRSLLATRLLLVATLVASLLLRSLLVAIASSCGRLLKFYDQLLASLACDASSCDRLCCGRFFFLRPLLPFFLRRFLRRFLPEETTVFRGIFPKISLFPIVSFYFPTFFVERTPLASCLTQYRETFIDFALLFCSCDASSFAIACLIGLLAIASCIRDVRRVQLVDAAVQMLVLLVVASLAIAGPRLAIAGDRWRWPATSPAGVAGRQATLLATTCVTCCWRAGDAGGGGHEAGPSPLK